MAIQLFFLPPENKQLSMSKNITEAAPQLPSSHTPSLPPNLISAPLINIYCFLR